jgi:hypothetical protein
MGNRGFTRKGVVVVAVVAVLATLGGTALAALVGDSGGAMVSRHVRTQSSAETFSNAGSWQRVPGAAVTLSIPSGGRLVLGRFTAESHCDSGGAGGYCSIRIMAKNNSSGALRTMHPAADLDFAFDTDSTDYWESNSVARAMRLGSGSWTVFAQRRVTSSSVAFRLDDWLFEVDANQ